MPWNYDREQTKGEGNVVKWGLETIIVGEFVHIFWDVGHFVAC